MPRCLVEVQVSSSEPGILDQLPQIDNWFFTRSNPGDKLFMPSKTYGRFMDLKFENDGLEVATAEIGELELKLGETKIASKLYPKYMVSTVNSFWVKS